MPPRGLAGRAILALCAALGPGLTGGAHAAPLTIFAAASLQGSLDEAVRAYERATSQPVRVAYGASSALARQIEAGAPAHLFISADTAWMAYVRDKGKLRGEPVMLLGNDLVLVAPAGHVPALRIVPGFALARALGDGRLAIADPAFVPAGKYARASLEALGAWQEVARKLAPAQDVRAALALVARGEAPLGIVYATDAAAQKAVAVVDTFPASTHPPIVYPLGVVRDAPPAAESLATFLASAPARDIWRRYGFRVPP
jgi:molybdate transport system substrate-binding protein